MNHTVMSQAQLDQLLADAKVGKAVRRWAESVGEDHVERVPIGLGDSVDSFVDEAVSETLEELGPWESLAEAVEPVLSEALTAAYQGAHDSLADHSEADKGIARGLTTT